MSNTKLTEQNSLRKSNLKKELYLILKQVKRIQQEYLKNNSISTYHEFKEKSSIMLDIWGHVNNSNIHENFVSKYIDIIIYLLEDIWKTCEGFSIPRDDSGSLINIDFNIIKLFKKHTTQYNDSVHKKSIWRLITEQRKKNTSIITIPNFSKNVSLTEGKCSNVFLTLKAILFNTQKRIQLRFRIYDKIKDCFLTDSYFAEADNNLPTFANDLNIKAVFRDLHEITEGSYLVCKIFEIDNNKNMYPYATFCVPINNLNEINEGKIFTPSPSISHIYNNEKNSDFIHMHKLIIKNDKNIQVYRNLKGMIVSLFCLKGNLDELITKDDKLSLNTYNQILSLKKSSNTLDKRIDMQITLLNGKFVQDMMKFYSNKKLKQVQKKSKNLKIIVTLLDQSGDQIENCFHLTPKPTDVGFSSYNTFIYSNENSPVYDETFYIIAKEKLLTKSILFLKYQHISKKDKSYDFGFSFIPFKHSKIHNIIIPNGSKDLSVYCGSILSNNKINFNQSSSFVRRKDAFYISTKYNSSNYSQNEILNKILHWKEYPKEFTISLNKYQEIPIDFLKKCWIKLLESLFDIITDKNINKSVQEKSMETIIYTICQIYDEQPYISENDKSYFIDNYIDNYFSNKDLHLYMNMHLKTIFDNNLIEKSKTFCILFHLFKFVFVSEKLNHPDCYDSTNKFINVICKQIEIEKISENKVLIIKSFIPIITLIKSTFNFEQIFKMISNIFQILESEKNTKIYVLSLNLLNHFLKEISNKANQSMIITEMMDKLNYHDKIKNQNSVKLYKAWANLLTTILSTFENNNPTIDILRKLVEILPTVFQNISITYEKNFGKKNSRENVTQNLLICYWQILIILYKQENFSLIEFSKQINVDFNKICECVIKAGLFDFKNDVFDESWIAIKVIRSNSISPFIIEISKNCLDFVKPNFRKEFWSSFIDIFISITNNSIFIIKKSKTKNFYVEKNSQIKNNFYECFKIALEKIGKDVLIFQSKIIQGILKVEREDIIKYYLNDVLYLLMNVEFDETKQLSKFESEITNDIYDTSSDSTETSMLNHFIKYLTEKLKKEDKIDFKNSCNEMIKTINQIILHTQKLSEISNRTDSNEYIQVDAFNKLLKILGGKNEIDKKVYRSYLKKFIKLNVRFENWVEAGLSQLKYINVLNNTEKNIEKKEYITAINYFEKCNDWERCIEICEMLEKIYKNNYEYNKVSKTLNRKADYYLKISNTKGRFFPLYYCVQFSGDFEKKLTSSDWVYRSKNLEGLTQFTSRIYKNYSEIANESLPNEKNKITIKSLEISNSIQINENKQMNLKNRLINMEYCKNNNVDEFFYSVPIQKGEKNSLKTLWTKKVFLKTEKTFPSVFRKSKVLRTWEKMCSPLETAIDQIKTKNIQLKNEIDNITRTQNFEPKEIKVLGLFLNGMIDAAVSGGTKLYVESFLLSRPKYIDLYPEESEKILEFIEIIKTQETLFKNGLSLLQKCEKYYSLHTHLSTILNKSVEQNQKLFDELE